jgi:hypothetical protein
MVSADGQQMRKSRNFWRNRTGTANANLQMDLSKIISKPLFDIIAGMSIMQEEERIIRY